MIVDAFLYGGEHDMLELRLRTLWDVVDYFVVVESDVAHAGQDKSISRPDRLERFKPWRTKMQPLIVTDTPRFWLARSGEGCPTCPHRWQEHTTLGCWHAEADELCDCTVGRPYGRSETGTPYYQKRERHDRDQISRLKSAYDDDTVLMVSDVDEIPRPQIVEKLAPDKRWAELQMRFHGFALDWVHPDPWRGTTVSRLQYAEAQAMRDARGNDWIDSVPDAGWHLSYMGSAAERERKLHSFSHGELVGRVDLDRCYRDGYHANNEPMARYVENDWPEPILTGEFQVPQSWRVL